MLSDAVLAVAEAMEQESVENSLLSKILKGFARELRTAVKASEHIVSFGGNAGQPLGTAFGVSKDSPSDPRYTEYLLVQEERRKIRAEKDSLLAEELDKIPGGAICVGGPHDGVTTELPPSMPVKASCEVGGVMYTLGPNRELHYNEERTQELRDAQTRRTQ